MKRAIAVIVLVVTQFGFGQAPAPTQERVVFQAVPIPQDQTYPCNAPAYIPTCGMLKDLVGLNSPAVDAVLTKYKVQVFDVNGVKISR